MTDDLLDSSNDEVQEVPETPGKKRSRKKVIFAAVAVVIVAALAIGAGVAYAQEQERLRQIEAHDAEVHAIYDGHKAELDGLDASYSADTERGTLFAALDDADAFKGKVEADKERFALHDGSLYNYDDLLSEADKYADAFKGFVVASYQKQLDGLLIADVNAEGITKEQLAENAAALQALADEAEADAQKRDVWESDDAKAAFTSKIAEAVAADNAKVAEIEEAERKAAEEAEAARIAAEQAAAQAAQSYSSGYSSGYSNNSGGYDSGNSGSSSNGGGDSSTGSWWYIDMSNSTSLGWWDYDGNYHEGPGPNA
ncbi:hypothetical protein [Eggerthella sp. YY7918]|uniref:hypothetical protein n=1 Tax=Eggerthella sp. (strain YY7918) TaxID=502558 RepID=UPI0002170F75|nr:hypothetical protein [Eggerthella sp. YY7918]BAK43298.1 hypothetical protein EGYY_00150 [Eggerthella sp. YY7918]